MMKNDLLDRNEIDDTTSRIECDSIDCRWIGTRSVKLVGIYGIQSKDFPNRWYVGQSRDILVRWHQAYELLKCKNQLKIYHALKKYGLCRFVFKIIEMCDTETPQCMLDAKEIAWIQHLNSINVGYNIRLGGSRGQFSSETRKKISDSLRGRFIGSMHPKFGKKVSATTLKKLSISHTGKHQSPETRVKMSIARTGKRLSAETISKIKLSKRFISDETRKKMSDAAILRHQLKREMRVV